MILYPGVVLVPSAYPFSAILYSSFYTHTTQLQCFIRGSFSYVAIVKFEKSKPQFKNN